MFMNEREKEEIKRKQQIIIQLKNRIKWEAEQQNQKTTVTTH
jgi:hypothetical protein